jgi:hypothetical protein
MIHCQKDGRLEMEFTHIIALNVQIVKNKQIMMTKRDNSIYAAARKHSINRDSRMSFICGARWADRHPDVVDMSYLQNWYQDSVDETKEPIWTDKHLEELFNDFYLIPKK